MIMLAGRTLMKSAKRFRSCYNYDRRWAAGEASISEVDGSRESSKLLLPLLSDISSSSRPWSIGGNGKLG